MKTITINLIAYNNKDEVLIIKRAKNQNEGGMWSFPGGTVKEGESIVRAIYREIKEELSVDIASIFLHDIIYGRNIVSYYVSGEIIGNIKLNEENSDFKWVLIKYLPKMAYNQHKLNFLQNLSMRNYFGKNKKAKINEKI